MEKVPEEAEAQQEKRERCRIELASQAKMRLLRGLLTACFGCAGIGSVGGGTMRGVATSVYRRVMDSRHVNVDVDMSMSSVTMTSHQVSGKKKAKTQQKAENEDQGKRIGRNHDTYSLLSWQYLSGPVPPQNVWGFSSANPVNNAFPVFLTRLVEEGSHLINGQQ